jgi:SAM-dependent methyltransferase
VPATSDVPSRSMLQRIVSGIDRNRRRLIARPYPRIVARLRVAWGVEPLAARWGQRGRVIHRYYIEAFVNSNAPLVRGRCLEFQEDTYATRFGGSTLSSVDIIHQTADNPAATIVADLTVPNAVEGEQFDCIICTQVLHLVDRPGRMVEELFRLLKPGGALLVAVPNITVDYGHWTEFRRFTPLGLELLLGDVFPPETVTVTSYGNALVAAGELRGLAVRDFYRHELEHNDPRFGLVACAVARKPA